MKTLWVIAAAVSLVLGAAGYTIAQSTGPGPQGGQGWMMGQGTGMMGGGMMGSGMMSMMMGQALTQEQLEQFAQQHGITVEQAQQMTDTCTRSMAGTGPQEQQPQ